MTERLVQKEVVEHIIELKEHVAKIEDKLDRHIHTVHRAFPRNDLQEPDFDGHRVYHAKKICEAKVVTEYKQSITGRILQGVTGFLLMLLGMGAVVWLKGI